MYVFRFLKVSDLCPVFYSSCSILGVLGSLFGFILGAFGPKRAPKTCVTFSVLFWGNFSCKIRYFKAQI